MMLWKGEGKDKTGRAAGGGTGWVTGGAVCACTGKGTGWVEKREPRSGRGEVLMDSGRPFMAGGATGTGKVRGWAAG